MAFYILVVSAVYLKTINVCQVSKYCSFSQIVHSSRCVHKCRYILYTECIQRDTCGTVYFVA